MTLSLTGGAYNQLCRKLSNWDGLSKRVRWLASAYILTCKYLGNMVIYLQCLALVQSFIILTTCHLYTFIVENLLWISAFDGITKIKIKKTNNCMWRPYFVVFCPFTYVLHNNESVTDNLIAKIAVIVVVQWHKSLLMPKLKVRGSILSVSCVMLFWKKKKIW